MTIEAIQQQVPDQADLWQYVSRTKPQIETVLQKFLPVAPVEFEAQFISAVETALCAGENRLHSVLTLLGAGLVGENEEKILPAAAAVEFIQASSRIFDDLPFLNGEETSEGKSLAAYHGEGLSVLVAVGLLNSSYGLVLVNHVSQPERAFAAHAEIVECVGASGIVGGQATALAGEESEAEKSLTAQSPRNLKNASLMRLALRIGAILAGADYLELNALSRFAEILSDAYNLSDNLSNPSADKDSVTDSRKETDSARRELFSLTEESKRVLIENFPPSEARSCLVQLADFLAERRI